MASQLEILKLPDWKKRILRLLTMAIMLSGCAVLCAPTVRAGNIAFTNSLAQAAQAEAKGDLAAALNLYQTAEQDASNNAVHLCALSHCYSELTYLTNAPAAQKTFMQLALNCALRAIEANPSNATAHASAAVCYAKICMLYDIKTELVDSRNFKIEAEKAIALDPKQDIAYYLLGRWNYGMANLGILSRTYVRVIYGIQPPASNEAAIQNFKQAVELAPDRLIYYTGLALAYEAAGQRKLEIEALKKCCEMKPVRREDQAAQNEARTKLAELGR
jgi:tetratricopeptide (TPR) repeat protein